MNDEQAIRDVQQRWFHATMNGCEEALRELMTEDVVFVTSGRAPFGRNDFLESFRSMRQKVTLHCEGDYREITIVGDIAYAIADLRIRIQPNDGSPAKDMAGNTLSILRRCADGRWRLARDANLLSATQR